MDAVNRCVIIILPLLLLMSLQAYFDENDGEYSEIQRRCRVDEDNSLTLLKTPTSNIF